MGLLVLSIIIVVLLAALSVLTTPPPPPDGQTRIRHLERDAQKEMRRITREFKRSFEETIAKGGPR